MKPHVFGSRRATLDHARIAYCGAALPGCRCSPEGLHHKRGFAYRHLLRIACAAGLLLIGVGCQTVKPWQREQLADPIMQPDRYPMTAALIDHVYFSREAANGGRSVGGGGCGCN